MRSEACLVDSLVTIAEIWHLWAHLANFKVDWFADFDFTEFAQSFSEVPFELNDVRLL